MQTLLNVATLLPTIIAGCLIIAAIYIMMIRGVNKSFIFETLSEQFSLASPEDKLLMRAGIKITAQQYKIALYTLCLVLGYSAIMYAILNKMLIFGVLGVIAAVFLAYILKPVQVIFSNIESPFIKILKSISKAKGDKFDDEIFNSCITLKNLSIVKQDNPISADMIFEQIMENSTKLRPIYAEMISVYRTGNPERAFEFFAEAVGTKTGKSFAYVLSKIDQINPAELMSQVIVLQEVMSEQRLTAGSKKAERNGVITITLATAVIFAMVLNFAFVVVMMDALNMVSNVF